MKRQKVRQPSHSPGLFPAEVDEEHDADETQQHQPDHSGRHHQGHHGQVPSVPSQPPRSTPAPLRFGRVQLAGRHRLVPLAGVEARERAGANQLVVRGCQARDRHRGTVPSRVGAELQRLDVLLGDDAVGRCGQHRTQGGGH